MTSGAGQADPAVAELWRLARRCGVKPAYTDNMGRRIRAAPDVLLAALRAWGIDIDRPDQAAEADRRIEAEAAANPVEPVTVLWQGAPPEVVVRRPVEHRDRAIELTLTQEHGPSRAWRVGGDEVQIGVSMETTVGRIEHVRVALPDDLPIGRHTLTIEVAGRCADTTLLVAPPQCRGGPDESPWRRWAAFLPLYALVSERSHGIGDLTDLHRLSRWVGRQGGGLLGTLPLLALFLDEPFDPSPYSPISRMFFNELYLDPEATPELAASAEARELIASSAYQREAAERRADRWTNYQRINALKRPVLSALAEALCSDRSQRLAVLDADRADDPLLDAYARFRAVTERRGVTWQQWPADLEQRARDNRLEPERDYDSAVYRYHLAAQWLLREQLAGEGGVGTDQHDAALYLDLPVGVNPGGFDAWWFADAFAGNVSAGAPPDDFFSGGQDWGFAPIHPQRSRADGHAGFAAAIAAHLRYCGALRIDHVMWLHRMYWIPHGVDAGDGLYVRYPSEELYAVLCIESHRHRAAIVGENLGTVPSAVNRTMQRRGVRPLYVGQFSFTDRDDDILREPDRGAVASLNTHDVPTFAAFWRGDDIDQRVELELMTEQQADEERLSRDALRRRVASYLASRGRSVDPDSFADDSIRSALSGLHERLAESRADLVLINLEDCWLERQPQNTPGTTGGHNWRRRAAYRLEEIEQGRVTGEPLDCVRAARGDGPHPSPASHRNLDVSETMP